MRPIVLALIVLFAWVGLAYADAIDGSWCNGAGGHVSIDGPKITLSSKTTIDGQYKRHEFLYKVPAGEADAGKLIYMQLLDEEDMQSFVIEDGKPGAQENWKRCAVTS